MAPTLTGQSSTSTPTAMLNATIRNAILRAEGKPISLFMLEQELFEIRSIYPMEPEARARKQRHMEDLGQQINARRGTNTILFHLYKTNICA